MYDVVDGVGGGGNGSWEEGDDSGKGNIFIGENNPQISSPPCPTAVVFASATPHLFYLLPPYDTTLSQPSPCPRQDYTHPNVRDRSLTLATQRSRRSVYIHLHVARMLSFRFTKSDPWLVSPSKLLRTMTAMCTQYEIDRSLPRSCDAYIIRVRTIIY